jgi:phage terminase small subunit
MTYDYSWLTRINSMAQEIENIARNDRGAFAGSRGLTTQQKAYVRAFISNGGNRTEAARTAGYASPSGAAWELARLAPVEAAIKKEYDSRINGPLASLALGVIGTILSTPPADKDARALQARVALKVVERARLGAEEVDKAQADKALGAMSVAELETFVAQYKAQEAATIDVTPAAGAPRLVLGANATHNATHDVLGDA